MAGEENPGVTSVERVEVTPAEGDDDIIQPEGTDADSPQQNDDEPEGGTEDPENDPEDESPDGKPESIRTQPAAATPGEIAPAPAALEPSNPYGLKRLPNEPPREFALRLELAKTRTQLREERGHEIMDTVRPATPTAQAVSPVAAEVLGKYKPEELAALREVLPVIAGEMGFVRKDEIAGSSYTEKVQEELDGFMEKHPEYSPENDPDGTQWNAFKNEFGQFKQPANPRDYRRLFERVHQTVFGIQAGGPLPKVAAAQRKVQVASHAGASGPTSQRQSRPAGGSSGLRLDALKGFSDEEKEEIAARGQ